MKPDFDLRKAVRFVAVFGLTYILSQFLRTSNAVLAPVLTAELALDPTDLGVLTGAFFLAFGAVQIPVGIMLDRIGPRHVVALALSLAVAGIVVFATAEGLAGLILGRILMGLGCAPTLMGAYVVFARWFPADRFATLSGMQLGIGYTGMLLATAPLALAVSAIGWRWSMAAAALWAAFFALVIYLFVRDAPPGHPLETRAPESLGRALAGVRQIIRDRRFWRLLPLQSVGYGATASILMLWAGPYLAQVQGLDGAARGNLLFLMGVGAIAGVTAFAPLDRLFNTRKGIVLAGSLASLGVMAALALVAHPPLLLVGGLFVLLAALGGYVAVLMSHIRMLFPDHLVGRGLTVANMCSMGGVALMQMATGAILSRFDLAAQTDGQAYRAVFLFLATVLALAVVVYSRSDDIRPLNPGADGGGQ